MLDNSFPDPFRPLQVSFYSSLKAVATLTLTLTALLHFTQGAVSFPFLHNNKAMQHDLIAWPSECHGPLFNTQGKDVGARQATVGGADSNEDEDNSNGSGSSSSSSSSSEGSEDEEDGAEAGKQKEKRHLRRRKAADGSGREVDFDAFVSEYWVSDVSRVL